MDNVVVVGTGLTAPGIAVAAAMASGSVFIVGRNRAHADAAVRTAALIAPPDSNIHSRNLEQSAFSEADLIIETIIEDLDTKVGLLRTIAPWLRSTAIVTTNTSSLPLQVLASAVDWPSQFAGLHFLHPAHQTSVVEVVAGPATDADVLQQLYVFAGGMEKTPIRVKRPIPGFVWNRIQFAVIRECIYLLDFGVADAIDIDTAIAEGLAPRWLAAGPLATADLGGTETFQRIAEELFPQLSADSQIRGCLAEGKPFYSWHKSSRAEAENLRNRVLALSSSIRDARHQLDDHHRRDKGSA